MVDIKEESFWQKLNPDIKKSVGELKSKYNIFKLYKRAEITGIIFLLIYFRKDINFDSINFFILMFIIGIFVVCIEKLLEVTQKDIKSIKTTIRNKMIVSICTCHRYCECKDDLDNYIKKMS